MLCFFCPYDRRCVAKGVADFDHVHSYLIYNVLSPMLDESMFSIHALMLIFIIAVWADFFATN